MPVRRNFSDNCPRSGEIRLRRRAERLAKVTAMSSKSLHRMVSLEGNPSMGNPTAIFGAVGKRLEVDLKAHSADLKREKGYKALGYALEK
jgi:hypothetical protein